MLEIRRHVFIEGKTMVRYKIIIPLKFYLSTFMKKLIN